MIQAICKLLQFSLESRNLRIVLYVWNFNSVFNLEKEVYNILLITCEYELCPRPLSLILKNKHV